MERRSFFASLLALLGFGPPNEKAMAWNPAWDACSFCGSKAFPKIHLADSPDRLEVISICTAGPCYRTTVFPLLEAATFLAKKICVGCHKMPIVGPLHVFCYQCRLDVLTQMNHKAIDMEELLTRHSWLRARPQDQITPGADGPSV